MAAGESRLAASRRSDLMRLETDDDVYAVDNVYLGPPGYTFPWKARYFAYGLWFALVVVGLIVERATVGLGVWPIVYLVLGAVLVTRVVGRRVSHDVPVRAI